MDTDTERTRFHESTRTRKEKFDLKDVSQLGIFEDEDENDDEDEDEGKAALIAGCFLRTVKM